MTITRKIEQKSMRFRTLSDDNLIPFRCLSGVDVLQREKRMSRTIFIGWLYTKIPARCQYYYEHCF